MKVKITQSSLKLCVPMDDIAHGILQARILEWVAFPFSRGSSQPRDQTQVSHIAGGFFTSWATMEAQKWKGNSFSPVCLFANPWIYSPWSFSGSNIGMSSFLPSWADLSSPGIELGSPAFAGRFFTNWAIGEDPIKTKIMAIGPITPWQLEEGKVEAVTDFIFTGSKITVDGDCSHELRVLHLGRKAMANQDSILKSRDISLPSKSVHIVRAMVFPVVTYRFELGHEGTEHWRIDSFKIWCWEKTSRIPWTARRSNMSILKEINPECLLERLLLKLKLQYFGHSVWIADSLEKDLDAEKEWRQNKRVAEDEIVW